jgi:hypothetical protein
MLGWTKGKPCWDQTSTLAGSLLKTPHHLLKAPYLASREWQTLTLGRGAVQSWLSIHLL